MDHLYTNTGSEHIASMYYDTGSNIQYIEVYITTKRSALVCRKEDTYNIDLAENWQY